MKLSIFVPQLDITWSDYDDKKRTSTNYVCGTGQI